MINKNAAVKQVFTFLLIAIIIGLTFLFAIKTIPQILNTSCESEEIMFIRDFKVLIEKYDSYGSVNIENILLPCKNNAVCFVDAEVIGSHVTEPNSGINPYINQSVENNISYNVFLLEGNIAKPILYSEKLQVKGDPQYLCINEVGGKVKIKFIGSGDKVSVTS